VTFERRRYIIDDSAFGRVSQRARLSKAGARFAHFAADPSAGEEGDRCTRHHCRAFCAVSRQKLISDCARFQAYSDGRRMLCRGAPNAGGGCVFSFAERDELRVRVLRGADCLVQRKRRLRRRGDRVEVAWFNANDPAET